jgi:RNA polymerase sigma factor (sigma-70 family)
MALDVNELYRLYTQASPEEEPLLLERLLSACAEYAYAICFKILHSRQPAVVNFSLFLVAKYLGSFRGDSKFSTWFYTIVASLCKKELRTRRFPPDLPLDEAIVFSTQDLEGSYALKEVIESLSPYEKSILEWKLSGNTSKDFGAENNLSESYARNAWWKLRKKLRRLLS